MNHKRIRVTFLTADQCHENRQNAIYDLGAEVFITMQGEQGNIQTAYAVAARWNRLMEMCMKKRNPKRGRR